AAPATWADQIYDYDLSLPSAVGLTVGNPDPSGIYPNKVLDYIGNLRRFVDGFAVSRPSAAAHEDATLVSILGPGTVVKKPGVDQDVGVEQTMRYGWSFFCDDPGTWKGLPDTGKVADACGGPAPTKARVVFSLDPWARVNTDAVQEPYTQQYNV